MQDYNGEETRTPDLWQPFTGDQLAERPTLSEIRPGQWLALATVRDRGGQALIPADIVVGEGPSPAEALAQLEASLPAFQTRQPVPKRSDRAT